MKTSFGFVSRRIHVTRLRYSSGNPTNERRVLMHHKHLTHWLALLLILLVGCTPITSTESSVQPTAAQVTAALTTPLPNFKHIFIIVMENKDYANLIGSDQAPYLNALAKQYGLATNYYGARHPSLPNYIALTSGDTFDITSDCTDCFVNAPNIVDQIETTGYSWKAYMESMPSPCFVGNAGDLYRQKHDPFIYYDDIRTNPARCNKIVPFTEFTADVKVNALPDFVWITPNMCHAMHDCPVSTGDTWLKTHVPTILASPAWKDNGVLFITLDEGSGPAGCCKYATGGRLATLVIAPDVPAGFTSNVPYSHYALLHTIETAWHLPLLGKANCDCTIPMTDFFAVPQATK